MSKLEMRNDWMNMTYSWGGKVLTDVTVVKFNHDGRNEDLMARMREVQRSYMDMGRTCYTNTRILEVFVPMLDAWVEVTSSRFVKAIYNANEWLT
jgi:hypothetical protein